MRPLALVLLLGGALAACGPISLANPPPSDRFYYPTGLIHLPANGTDGVLVVAGSNFDKRFDFGSLLPIDLSRVGGPEGGLPAFSPGAGFPAVARQLPDLNVPEDGPVFVQSFAGQIARMPRADGTARLFVPSWAEGHYVQAIEAQGPSLRCFGKEAGERNCLQGALSLVANEKGATDVGQGQPRAPEPFGVDWAPSPLTPGDPESGDVFVTHLRSADTPPGSRKDFRTYAVKLTAGNPLDAQFVPLGNGATHGVAIGRRYAFLSGRFVRPFPYLVRLVDRLTTRVIEPALEAEFHVLDGRGIGLSERPAAGGGYEGRLYVAARSPSALVVVAVQGSDGESPALNVVRSVLLPEGASEVRVIPRPGRGDLVLVTCTSADSMAIYDDDIGQVVAQVRGLGAQPFGITYFARGGGARVFVSAFEDGRVAVVDIPSLADPQTARVVAHLGRSQVCLVNARDPSCEGVVP